MLESLATLPFGFILSVALLLGLLVGSFLNVVIYRLPKMMMNGWRQDCCEILEIDNDAEPQRFNLVVPHSHCPGCGKAIKPWQNIPLLSYLMLKGRCGECAEPISIRYPLIELATGLLSLTTIAVLGPTLQGLLALLLVWNLVALTVIDMDHKLIFDNLTLPLLWLGLLANAFGVFTSLENAVFGAMGGYLILWSVYWIFKLLRNKEGMGYGDFKLLAAFGAWMGWQALPLVIIMSSLVGLIIGGGAMIVQKRGMDFKIPFGPYLAMAGFITLLWGEELTRLYFSIMMPV